MKCLNQNCGADEIESDDNFCYKCGHWTSKGYSFLKDKENVNMIMNGTTLKQNDRLSTLAGLLALSIIVFTVMPVIRGNDLFKPLFYLKKQFFNYVYGYNTSSMKIDNKYTKKNINDYNDALDIIRKDFDKQDLYCFNTSEVDIIERHLEDKYLILSVSFCDMNAEEAKKIERVIDRMYSLFPSTIGALTNITITNATTKSEYIARFQPMYQFVNINENINDYNKVNKTQILLNSYYFLNSDIMKKSVNSVVGENWYVEDATWESTIAHELGHYISFLTLLKANDISNIVLVTKENSEKIDNILKEFNDGSYSHELLYEALVNYNNKYNASLSLDEFASSISNYADFKDKDNNLIADETIAEAIHDYYLHDENMKPSSREIIKVIKAKL